jgi:hypothetical protein
MDRRLALVARRLVHNDQLIRPDGLEQDAAYRVDQVSWAILCGDDRRQSIRWTSNVIHLKSLLLRVFIYREEEKNISIHDGHGSMHG